MNRSIGAYFLANDRTIDLAIAFLNSFRRYNPSLPLCLIPFDDRCRQVAALAGAYRFEVLDDPMLLEQCDAWSRRFHSGTRGQYRKLAMWSGPFERFLYIDIDTVVVADLSFVFAHLDDWDAVTSHSNLDGSRKYVWRPEFERDLGLTDEQLAYAANTGFIASRRGLLNLPMIRSHMDQAAGKRHAFELMCMEQPLLNYLLVHATARYTSLSALRTLWNDESIPHECWPGDPNWNVTRDGTAEYAGMPKTLMFIHWAGQWTRPRFTRRVLDTIFSLGLGNPRAVRRDLKMGNIWSHWRNLPAPRIEPERRLGADSVAATPAGSVS